MKLLMTYDREKRPIKEKSILKLEAENKEANDHINNLKEELKSIDAYI